MGPWLAQHGFDVIDAGARSCLRKIFEKPAILEWRRGLNSPGERASCNHPKIVLSAYKAATKEKAPTKDAKAKLKAAWEKFDKLARKSPPALVVEVTGHDLGIGKAQPAIATAMQKKLSRVAATDKLGTVPEYDPNEEEPQAAPIVEPIPAPVEPRQKANEGTQGDKGHALGFSSTRTGFRVGGV